MMSHMRHICVLLLSVLALAGCQTTAQRDLLPAEELQARVLHLENLASQRDTEISQLRDELQAERQMRHDLETQLKGQSSAAATSMSLRNVQRSLTRAGFDPGKIDGIMGSKTRTALRAFQRAHGLSPDGRVGPHTIAKLKPYIEPLQ
jgi:murein L,D-transpeptidase YcbB/YkuD